MSLNLDLLGITASRCMDSIEERFPDGDAELVAVGIVVVVEQDDETQTRTFCSVERYFEQLGLLQSGVECIRDGVVQGADDLEDEDE